MVRDRFTILSAIEIYLGEYPLDNGENDISKDFLYNYMKFYLGGTIQ
jgi:hypothetical protein